MTATETTLAAIRQPSVTQVQPVTAGFFNAAGFDLMQRVAKGFASSTLVPKEFQGNVANCMIALNLAQRIQADPLMCMQNLFIVHGRPGWSAQFLVATFNQCGRFSALRYEFFGEKGKDSWGCRAWANEISTGDKIVGADITIGLAKAEGWVSRSGSKWVTMPQQMLMYRAAAWLIRAYAPEIAMGLPTAEEVGDTFDAERDSRGAFQVTLESLDRSTGEIKPAATAKAGDSPVTAAGLLAQIAKAKTEDDLAVAADLIGAIADDAERVNVVTEIENRRIAIGSVK